MNIINYFKIGILSFIKFPLIISRYFYIGLKSLFLTLPLFLIDIFRKKENKLSTIILILSITTYLISIFILTRWYVQNERTKKFTESMLNENIIMISDSNEYEDSNNTISSNVTSSTQNQQSYDNLNFLNVNLNYYLNKNSDTVGWIKINGTNINYPIVQTKDNKYYLNHDFYKRKTSVGWIFSDYRNNLEELNNNTIIYGHNLINRTMFGDIPTFLNKSWLNKSNKPYIKLSSKKQNSIWQIFSIYKTKPTTDYLQAKFNSLETYEQFLNTIKNKSIKDLGVELISTDKIITLSTCDDTGNYRVVVHAKLIKIENKY